MFYLSIFFVGVVLSAIYYFNFVRVTRGIYERMLPYKNAILSKKWLLPAIKLSEDNAVFYFFLTIPGLRLVVEDEALQEYAGVMILPSFRRSTSIVKSIPTNNQEFDKRFRVAQWGTNKQDESVVRSKITIGLQEKILNFDRELCKQIVNRYFYFTHVNGTRVAWFEISNYLLGTSLMGKFGRFAAPEEVINELKSLMVMLLEIYKEFKLAGPIR